MRSRVGVVLGVVAVVVAIIAVIGPWWTFEAHGSFGGFSYSGNDQFGLFGGSSAAQAGSSSSSNTTSYTDMPHIGSVFTLATLLLAAGLVIGIGMIVVGTLSASKPSFSRLGGILGILACVIVLVSPLYVMSALPGAVNQDSGAATSSTTVNGFWGSETRNFGSFAQANLTWAAGWGWYLALAAAIIFLVAAVALFSSSRRVAVSPPST